MSDTLTTSAEQAVGDLFSTGERQRDSNGQADTDSAGNVVYGDAYDHAYRQSDGY